MEKEEVFAKRADQYGSFSNAFRVTPVPLKPESIFLDFLCFCPDINKAKVVARVEILQSSLPHLRDHLDAVVDEAVR